MAELSLYNEIIEILQREAELNKYVAISPDALQELYTDFPPRTTDNAPVQGAIQPTTAQPAPVNAPQAPSAANIAPQETPGSSSIQQAAPQAEPQQVKASATPAITAASIDLSALTPDWLKANSTAASQIYTGSYLKISGEGDTNADLMFLGEAQGRGSEYNSGEPSELLTKMIGAMNFSRESVYICDLLYTIPESPEMIEKELSISVSYIQKLVSIIKPKVIVFLGPLPLRLLLNERGISRHHGNWHEYMGAKVMPTYHPALLLREPSSKKAAWEDLKKVMSELNS